jgi:hypothetical protein
MVFSTSPWKLDLAKKKKPDPKETRLWEAFGMNSGGLVM